MTERREPATEAGRAGRLPEPEGEGWDVEVRMTKRDLHTLLNRHVEAMRPAIEREATDARVAALVGRIAGLPTERLDGNGEIGLVEEWDLTVEVIGKQAVLALLSDLPAEAAERPLDVEESIVWLADTDGRAVHAYNVHPTIHATMAAPGSVAGVSLCGNGFRHTDSRVSEAYGACPDCYARLSEADR